MKDESTREQLGLSQERMASWLGIARATLAQVETGRRSLPAVADWQKVRLLLATMGLVPQTDGSGNAPAPPPLPAPAPDRKPLQKRLAYCRYHAERLGRELAELREQATRQHARLAAIPALRAWTGPVTDPEREARWLTMLEEETVSNLRYVCGPGPQRLLEIRIAGLEREAELLEAELAEPAG